MEPLSNKRKLIESKPLNFWERAYLPAIISGLSITMKHFFKKPVTISYPEEKREFSENFRGMKMVKNVVPHAGFVHYHALLKPSP
jgi:NADH-quinone oxidoreductase subunit I